MAAMTDFLKIMENKSVPVRQRMDSAKSEKNRANLAPTVRTIIFCGQQNVALWGLRNDFKHFNTDEDPFWNYELKVMTKHARNIL